jgi:calpain family cysteine protease
MTMTSAPMSASRISPAGLPTTEPAGAPAPAAPASAPAPAAGADRFRAAATANPFATQLVVDLPDPAFMKRNQRDVDQGREGVRRVHGQMFVDGPSLEDPKQGWAGDCYLIAAMGALADVAPDRIRDMMRQDPDAKVTVSLFDEAKDGKLQKKEVTVDADLLTRTGPGAGSMVYASSAQSDAAGRPEMWVPLLEKALAQLRGGYDEIAYGGHPGAALEALTGVKSKDQPIGTRLDRLELAMGERLAAVFKVKPELLTGPMLEAREKNMDKAWDFLKEASHRKDAVEAATYAEPEMLEKGLMPMHAYTVVGVEEKDGQRLVTLRNPAPYIPELEGNEEVRAEMMRNEDFKQLAELLTSKGKTLSSLNYGTFTIPFEQFQNCFANAYRCPIGTSG